jgi:hypothetical protein
MRFLAAFYFALLAILVSVQAIATSTVPTADALNVHCFVGKGTAGRDAKLLDFDDTASLGAGTTANAVFTQQLKLAAGASDTSINLSSYFDNCSYVAVREISAATSGVLVGPATTNANKFTLAASGVYVFKNGAGTPPTLYFTNPSGSDTVYVEVVAVGNRT